MPPPKWPAASVSVSTNPANLPANGSATALVTASVKDINGDPVTDETVTFSASSGSIRGAQNNGDGTYTATYTAGTSPGVVTITAVTSNSKSGEVQITLTELPRNAGSGTMTVTGGPVSAGSTGNTLTFIYTAEETMDGGGLELIPPPGWTEPQGAPGSPGYTTVETWGNFSATVSFHEDKGDNSPDFTGKGINILLARGMRKGDQIKIIYGAGGGNNGVTAPSTPGLSFFDVFVASTFPIGNAEGQASDAKFTDVKRPFVSIQAADGSGIVVITDKSGNRDTFAGEKESLTFTFTADGPMNGGTFSVTIDDSWPIPTSENTSVQSTGSVDAPIFLQREIRVPIVFLSGTQTITVTYGRAGKEVSAPAIPETSSFFFKSQGSPNGLLARITNPNEGKGYPDDSFVVKVSQANNAPDGSGTMTVNLTTVTAGNVIELIFTYTPAGPMNGGKIQLTVPSNWTSPIGTPGQRGFTTAETDPGASLGTLIFSGKSIIVPITSLTVGQTVRIKYGSGGGNNGVIAPREIGSATFNVKSQGQTDAQGGQLIELVALPVVSVTPTGDGSGTATVRAAGTVTAGSRGNSVTIVFTAADHMIDGAVSVTVPFGWSSPEGRTTVESTGTIGSTTFSGQTVTAAGVNLSANQTITFRYTDVTAQGNAGLAAFVVKSKGTEAGTLTILTNVPTVTVGNAADGSGTLTATPSTVVAGEVVNIDLIYTAIGTMTNGVIRITVPDAWTLPQVSDVNGPGYIAVQTTGIAQAPLVNGRVITVLITSLNPGGTVTISYRKATVPNTSGVWPFNAESRGSATGTSMQLAQVPSVSTRPLPSALSLSSADDVFEGDALPLTVEMRDANGKPAASTSPVTVNLSSSSTTGRFDTAANGSFNRTTISVTIPAGAISATAFYKDTQVDTAILTASATGLTSATQAVRVKSVVTSVSVGPSPVKAGGTVTVTAIGKPGAAASFSIGNNLYNIVTDKAMTESVAGTYTGTFTSIVDVHPDGTYNVVVKIGNSSQTVTGGIVIDNVAPVFTVTANPTTIQNGQTLTLSVKSESGLSVSADVSVLDSTQTGSIPLAESQTAAGIYTASILISEKNTVSDGQKTVTLTARDAAENVTAATVLVELHNRVTQVISSTLSTLATDKDQIVALGIEEATITITVLDESGKPIQGQLVEITVSPKREAENTISQPQTLTDANGITTAKIRSTKAELKTVTATVGDQKLALKDSVTLRFVPGPVSKASITAEPKTLVADGKSTSNLTIMLTDAQNNPISGQQLTINLAANRGTVGSVTDKGDGTYTATYTAGTIAGDVEITAVTSNGKSGVTTIRLTEREIDPAKSTVEIDPSELVADGATQATITITLLDKQGLKLGGKQVQLSAAPTDGVNLVQPALTNASGMATAKISSTKAGSVTITAMVGGVELSQKPSVKFIAREPHTITVASDKAKLLADGTSTAQIAISVFDANSNPVKSADLTLTATLGNIPQKPTNNGDGTYTATYTAGNTLGPVTVTARTSNQKQGSVTLTLVVGPPARIQLSSDVTELVAGSGTIAKLTATVTDAAGHPIGGAQVTMELSPKQGVLSKVIDPGDGTYTATYTAGATPGTVTITAKIAATSLQDSVVLTLTETLKPDPIVSTVIVKDGVTVVTANNIDFAEIVVTLLSARGQPVPGYDVRLSVSGTDNTVEPKVRQTDDLGIAQFTLRSTRAEAKTVTAEVLPAGPILKDSVTLQFVAGPAFEVKITAPAKLEVGEQEKVSITVRDRYGNPISGETLRLRADRGQVPSQPIDVGNGQYTFLYTAPATTGEATLTASTPTGKTGEAKVLITDSVATIRSVQVKPPLLVKAKDTLTVEMDAEAGGKASFTIDGVPGKHPMPEGEPGHYRGAYTVEAGVNAQDAAVQVAFEDASGNRAVQSAGETVTIDTTPPPAPGDIRVVGDGITKENESAVQVKGMGSPGSHMFMEVRDKADGPSLILPLEATATTSGEVNWTFDARGIPDGELFLVAYEAPDEAGNPGVKGLQRIQKDTRPEGAILFVTVSERVPVFSEIQAQVTVGFIGKPPERIKLVVTLIAPSGKVRQEYTLEDVKNRQPQPIKFMPPDVLGEWRLRVHWPGDKTYRPEEDERRFTVTSAPSTVRLDVLSTESPTLGAVVRLGGALSLPLEGEKISLQVFRPEGEAWENWQKILAATDADGAFDGDFTPDEPGAWQVRVYWEGRRDDSGNYIFDPAQSAAREIQVQFPRGKVIIAAGGEASLPFWREYIFGTAVWVYDSFVTAGFAKETIRFLSPSEQPPSEGLLSEARLKDAILQWGTTDLSSEETLWIYLISDNLKEGRFVLERTGPLTDFLEQSAVQSWLEALNEKGVNTVLVMEACYSGAYIQPLQKPLKARQIVITSASAQEPAHIRRSDSFSRRFFDRLVGHQDMAQAFAGAQEYYKLWNTAQVDANRDGIPNKLEDLAPLKRIYLEDPKQITLGSPAELFAWSDPIVLSPGERSATIEATIGGGAVQAWMAVFPPEYPRTFSDWSEIEVPESPMTEVAPYHFRATDSGFTQPGSYRVVIYAQNSDGPAEPGVTTVTVLREGAWDANSDGSVNVLDLVLVAGHFGEKPPTNPRADVNGDGAVNIQDLVLVAGHFGEAAAAPARIAISLTDSQHQTLAQVQGLLQTDSRPEARRLAALLDGWLSRPLPTRTRLLPAYPNPANPEVWIPYTLAVPSSVEIRIFDLQGRLVRALSLGHQPPGEYIRPTDAAHWDGRNATGERVASGVYFIQWQTGTETTTRRILLRK